MSKPRPARIHDLLGLLHGAYPTALAEEWDNVGLQVGDPSAAVERVLIGLDPSDAALAAADAAGAQVLLCHHPLLFRPLRNLTPKDETGRLLWRAVQEGIAVISAHTNLDRGRDGLNDWLAQRLGLQQSQPLGAGESDLLKLVVFVPTGYEETVASALFAAGAGQVGAYDHCAFRVRGSGSFHPGAETEPFICRVGQTAQIAEIRLETILPRSLQNRVVERMLKAHPYEEVAYDLIPLANRRSDVGLGRIGRLAEASQLGPFASRVRDALGASHVRLVGEPGRSVSKIAVCGGSGASLLAEAIRQGADVLVTGDVKYHEARQAEAQGIGLIDAGHFHTERLMVAGLAARLRQAAAQRGLTLEFIEMTGEQDPFRVI
jgi:dinuclear metal center YbgI/SA1388 family protein